MGLFYTSNEDDFLRIFAIFQKTLFGEIHFK